MEQACKKLFVDDALYTKLGAVFRERRQFLNLTVAKAVRLTGIKISTLKNVEKGVPFSVSSVLMLLDAYGLDAEQLLPPHGGPIEPLPEPIPAIAEQKMVRIADGLTAAAEHLKSLAVILENISLVADGQPEIAEPFIPGERKNNIIINDTLASTQVFGRRVQSLRIARGIPIHHLGANSTIGEGAIISIEAGIRNPSLLTAYEIAEALKVECAFLFSNSREAHLNHLALQLRAASLTASRHREQIGDLFVACEHIHDVIMGTRAS
ncbi:hypothetical protein A0U89_15295 (plasmid) [Kozakia baliensis]|uniref:HTH cro/C1-type domain-containing protein n=1 Tax=Kozakia baliensis TaxID=153496 RepID=A0A1D8UYK0_9PROT|nr:hypothetical protein A0U89_15295 [Kozakia baliensis]